MNIKKILRKAFPTLFRHFYSLSWSLLIGRAFFFFYNFGDLRLIFRGLFLPKEVFQFTSWKIKQIKNLVLILFSDLWIHYFNFILKQSFLVFDNYNLIGKEFLQILILRIVQEKWAWSLLRNDLGCSKIWLIQFLFKFIIWNILPWLFKILFNPS
jgi:hypothetical protein